MRPVTAGAAGQGQGALRLRRWELPEPDNGCLRSPLSARLYKVDHGAKPSPIPPGAHKEELWTLPAVLASPSQRSATTARPKADRSIDEIQGSVSSPGQSYEFPASARISKDPRIFTKVSSRGVSVPSSTPETQLEEELRRVTTLLKGLLREFALMKDSVFQLEASRDGLQEKLDRLEQGKEDRQARIEHRLELLETGLGLGLEAGPQSDAFQALVREAVATSGAQPVQVPITQEKDVMDLQKLDSQAMDELRTGLVDLQHRAKRLEQLEELERVNVLNIAELHAKVDLLGSATALAEGPSLALSVADPRPASAPMPATSPSQIGSVAAQFLRDQDSGRESRLDRVERIEEVNIATVAKLCAKVEELDARMVAQRAVDRLVAVAGAQCCISAPG